MGGSATKADDRLKDLELFELFDMLAERMSNDR